MNVCFKLLPFDAQKQKSEVVSPFCKRKKLNGKPMSSYSGLKLLTGSL